jgi:MerR family transcriptional regulator, copper efflux regulator
MNSMTIGQVAQKAGIGIETIRFYERKGLIDEPPRKESGYRLYNADVVDRLAFIQQAKTLGFTLAEIQELLSLKISPETTSREIKMIAEAKLVDIEAKIKILKRMQRALKKLVGQCPGRGPVDHCPILEALGSVNPGSSVGK